MDVTSKPSASTKFATSPIGQAYTPSSNRGTDSFLEYRPRKVKRVSAELLGNPDVLGIAERYFSKYDSSGRGSLSIDQCRNALRELQQQIGFEAIDDTEANRLIKRFDLNKDGVLSLSEFLQFFFTILRKLAFDRSRITGRDFFVAQTEGNIWDAWEKTKELGTGTFGVAHLCQHKTSQEIRVIKTVRKSRAKIPVEDIEREIMIMNQIDHPHVVRLFSWAEDQHNIYLVLDALDGGTLKDVVLQFTQQKKPIKEGWARDVTRQVLEAMAYCHNLRVIHKDLKDENIMLLKKDSDYDEPFAVVIDLGIAEMFSISDPMGRELGGTPFTMAPEVWVGSFGANCDVWSMGCVLFELLTGKMPFVSGSLDPNVWRRLHKRGPDWSRVKTSPMSKNLCQMMLTYDDLDRPSMKTCLRADWFQVDSSELQTISAEQFDELARFAEKSALKRTLFLEIASRLPMGKAGQIVDIFNRFDVNKDGSLSKQELKKTLEEMGLRDQHSVDKMFKALDVDGDGVLSFSEFAAGTLVLFKDLLDDRLQRLFQRRDVAEKGYLTPDEVRSFLKNSTALLTKEANQRSFNQLEDLLQEGQGQIRYEDLREKLLGF
jgi:calcium-dependent protein kinase